MSSAIAGDPESWTGAAQQLFDLHAGLHSAIDQAHTTIASLPDTWKGPAAESFTGSWAKQYSQLGELADLLADAGNAMNAYGQVLEQSISAAASAARTAAAAGLAVEGRVIGMPFHAAALPPATQSALQHALGQAHSRIYLAQQEAAAAEARLSASLRPVISAFQDWGTSHFGADVADIAAAAAAVPLAVGRFLKSPTVVGEFVSEAESHIPDAIAEITRRRASQLGRELRLGSRTAGPALRSVAADAKFAAKAAHWAGSATAVVTAGMAIYSVVEEHHAGHTSWGTAAGDNVGDLFVAAAGVALVVAGPGLVVGIGATVLIAGVGYGLQKVWDHREQIGLFEMNVASGVATGVKTGVVDVQGAAASAEHAASNAVHTLWHKVI